MVPFLTTDDLPVVADSEPLRLMGEHALIG
jgi:hypothetical protein